MKKKVKRFDVWVTRDHQGDSPRYNQIEVTNALTRSVTRTDGCCLFQFSGRGLYNTEKITVKECLARYGFLPRPGQCWNVWVDARGNIQYQEHPVLEWYDGTLYKKVTLPEEREYYLVSPK